MTRIEVRLVGESQAVRRVVAALREMGAADERTSYRTAASVGDVRAYLALDVPSEEPLVFTAAPPRGRKRFARGQDETHTVAALQAHPGEWAHVATVASPGSGRQTASTIRRGRRSHYRPAGAYEAEHHPAEDGSGEWWVYARYVGGGPS